MTRTKKKTSLGSRLLAAALLVAAALPLAGEDRKPASYAVVTGTVFRDTGMSLPGAEVTLAAAGDSKEAKKFKKQTVAASPRGEFVFRVPAAAGNYTVSVRASGYESQQKPVTVTGEERIDVFFRLEPASK